MNYEATFVTADGAEAFAANLEAYEDEAENIEVVGLVVTWASPKQGYEYEITLAEVFGTIQSGVQLRTSI